MPARETSARTAARVGRYVDVGGNDVRPPNQPCSTVVQLEPTTPKSWKAKPPEPLAFQSATSPLLLRHRIPSSPLPLKSPIPSICQLWSTTPKSSYVKPPEPLAF